LFHPSWDPIELWRMWTVYFNTLSNSLSSRYYDLVSCNSNPTASIVYVEKLLECELIVHSYRPKLI
jgi:hypothetical protein